MKAGKIKTASRMAGLPAPLPTKVEDNKILCIPDLEKAGSAKLSKGVRGEWTRSVV